MANSIYLAETQPITHVPDLSDVSVFCASGKYFPVNLQHRIPSIKHLSAQAVWMEQCRGIDDTFLFLSAKGEREREREREREKFGGGG